MKNSKSYYWKNTIGMGFMVLAVVIVYVLLFPVTNKVKRQLQGFCRREDSEEYVEATLFLEGRHYNYVFNQFSSQIDMFKGRIEIVTPEGVIGSPLSTVGYMEDFPYEYYFASWMYYYENSYRNGYLFMDNDYNMICITSDGVEYYFPAQSREEAEVLRERYVF